MKKVIVPRSVKKKVRREIFTRFIGLAVLLVIAYFIADWLTAGDFENLKFKAAGPTAVAAFIFIIPFIVSGIPLKLIDKSWYGQIISIETETVKAKEKIHYATDRNHYLKQTALVKTPNEKLYERRIYDEGTLLHENSGEVYSVGDTVVHVYGTDYLVPVCGPRKEPKDHVVCAYCGYKSLRDKDTDTKICKCCGCSTEILIADSNGKKG